MTRTKHRLSARAAMTLASVGRHADGGNLYLSISPNGGRRWVFMYQRDGKQRELGLGPAIGLNRAGIALQVARDKADAARALLLAGNDPIEAKRAARHVPTFGEFADQLLASIAAGFKNERSLGQWRASLEQDAAPLRALRIDQINTANVLSVLRPIWNTKHETAARLRGRIERVLDAAKAEGLRSGDNPARWRGNLKSLLSKRQRLTRGHLAAIKFKDMPAFMTKLRKRESISARALEFTILTAARTNEVLGASWQEFDLKVRLWTIPAKRRKAGREHVVPLSARAVAILRAMRPEGLERKLDFPIGRPGTIKFNEPVRIKIGYASGSSVEFLLPLNESLTFVHFGDIVSFEATLIDDFTKSPTLSIVKTKD